MPELCRFYGIVIRMYYGDHLPAHFHAAYGDYEAVIGIENLSILRGTLPRRALGLVAEWASLHKEELRAAWHLASELQPLARIDPLP